MHSRHILKSVLITHLRICLLETKYFYSIFRDDESEMYKSGCLSKVTVLEIADLQVLNL